MNNPVMYPMLTIEPLQCNMQANIRTGRFAIVPTDVSIK